jgi:hypothetical protein
MRFAGAVMVVAEDTDRVGGGLGAAFHAQLANSADT